MAIFRSDKLYRALEIRQNAALAHLPLDDLRRLRHADGDRLALAHFVLQNAQGLVERGDDEISDAIADCLFLRGGIGGDGEGRSAGDVGRNNQRSAILIQFARVEEVAPEADLRVSKRGFEQARVGQRNSREEVECRRGWRIESQDFIISSQLSAPAVG